MARRRPAPDPPTPVNNPPPFRRARATALLAALIAGTGIAIRALRKPGTPAHRIARSASSRARRHAHRAWGRLRGLEYRLTGGHPEPDVTDDILADRIRSTLGPIEKRLDIPRVHVMVSDHVAVLHGGLGSRDEERAITEAVESISGVTAVESRLHVGLSAGSTRPSAGRKSPADRGRSR